MLSYFDRKILNWIDRLKIRKLKRKYFEGNITAHYKAEAIRRKYGYSDGRDGNNCIQI